MIIRKESDTMTIYFPEGSLINTRKNEEALSSLGALKEAFLNETVLEARAKKCDREYNIHVDFGFARGIIPKNEGAVGIDDGSVREIALITRVGRPVQFVVTGIDTDVDGKVKVLLSRRRAQEKCSGEYINQLRPGDVIDAVVTHMEGFGAFCDVGAGVSALLPVDHISVSRISHPADRFSPGQKIRAIVRARDTLGRLTLSHKELLGTWEENASRLSAGETVSGIIRSVEKYGVFVELLPNLAGLAEGGEGYRPGQSCVVYIKSLIPEKMKIKLNIILAGDDPPEKMPVEYFFRGDHMDFFRYSPPLCERTVETVF